MNIKKAIIIILFVLVLHAIGSSGVYWTHQWFDAPVHFAGGFAAGALGLAVWNLLVKSMEFHKEDKKYVWIITCLFTLGFVALIGIAWELHEYILDVLKDNMVRQPSLADTMSDFVLDLAGGLLAYAIWWKKSIR